MPCMSYLCVTKKGSFKTGLAELTFSCHLSFDTLFTNLIGEVLEIQKIVINLIESPDTRMLVQF